MATITVRCKVSFDSQGGSAVSPIYVEKGNTITLPVAPTLEDYTFDGWYTAVNGGGTEFTAQTTVSSSITLYAKWTFSGTLKFTTQPVDTSHIVGFISGSLTAAVNADSATLNWYACNSAGTVSGSSLGTGGSFAIPTNLAMGTYYYLCRVVIDAKTADSVVATVTVTPFVAVTGISGVPTAATVGTDLTLTGTVAPAGASFKTIVWSVKNAGTTGATISGSTLSTTNNGTVTVTATIANGTAAGTAYTQDFTIAVSYKDVHLDIKNGNINLDTYYGSPSFQQNNGSKTTYTGKVYITGTSSDYYIAVGGATHNVVFEGLNIDLKNTIQNNHPVQLSFAAMNLTLIGSNSLHSKNADGGKAGFDVEHNSTLNITKESTGTLRATGSPGSGAGILCNDLSANVNIAGGTVIATGTGGGAGIGGGLGSHGGTVTITGGTVIAAGSAYNEFLSSAIGVSADNSGSSSCPIAPPDG